VFDYFYGNFIIVIMIMMINDEWWMMNDEWWWMMNDEWWMMNDDEWWYDDDDNDDDYYLINKILDIIKLREKKTPIKTKLYNLFILYLFVVF
jgi:hypothetical protein